MDCGCPEGAGHEGRELPGRYSCKDQVWDRIFWLLDLNATKPELRHFTQLKGGDNTLTFDITPDGAAIILDRLSDNSDLVLIELDGTAE